MTPRVPRPALSPAAAAGEPRPRVLVTDDSRVIRHAIRKILEPQFDIVQADNGNSAWEHIVQDPTTTALITDIEMPGLDGYGLICQIRAAGEGRIRDMPVIAITGADDDQTRQRAFACGATDFITKPIDATQLAARVQAYVRYDQSTRELTQRSAALEQQSVSDPHTGLHSRRYFVERGEQDLAFAVRRAQDITLIRVEVDQFRKIYQAHGDDVNDRLLLWVAHILSIKARAEDTVARVGGAEFAILAPATDIQTARALCDRLRAATANDQFRDGALTIPVTFSMGLASLGQDRHEHIEQLLKLAQQRLHHAQSEGGNRVCTSVLGEATPHVEEVTVAPIESLADAVVHRQREESRPNLRMEPPEESLQFEHKPGLSTAAPAQAIAVSTDLVNEQAARAPTRASQAGSDGLVPAELVSVDKALQLLAQGEGEMLRPYLNGLVAKLKPLLYFCRVLRQGEDPERV